MFGTRVDEPAATTTTAASTTTTTTSTTAFDIVKDESSATALDVSAADEQLDNQGATSALLTCYLAVTRIAGTFELYAVPSMTLVFATRRFASGARVLQHSARAATFARAALGGSNNVNNDVLPPLADGGAQEARVVELLVTSLADAHACDDDGALYVVALLANDEMLVYRAFRCVLEARVDERLLPLRWSRVDVSHVRRSVRAARTAVAGDTNVDAAAAATAAGVAQLRAMGDVGGLQSIVVGGVRPLWLVQVRGTLRVHPFWLGDDERGGPAFAPFDHVSCPAGFVCYEPNSMQLRFCQVKSKQN